MADVQKVSSGIPGLDDLIEGGFWPKSTVVILGSSGTGKSTFAIQFLMEGIEQGEQALYVTLEEPPEQIMREADLRDEKEALLVVLAHVEVRQVDLARYLYP